MDYDATLPCGWHIRALDDDTGYVRLRHWIITDGAAEHILPVGPFHRAFPQEAAEAWIAEGFPPVEAMGGTPGFPLTPERIEVWHLRRRVTAVERLLAAWPAAAGARPIEPTRPDDDDGA